MSNTAAGLAACRRALDEKAVATRGPLAAIIAAPNDRVAVRRASYVLGMHREGEPLVGPLDVFFALKTWRLLNVAPS